ncbi:MAG: ThuA domain-containing protein [Verrucomicrobiae bacterium]|nr:ThuA domain-containing protein [Verrucomicrobiae bacterium]
MIRRCLVSFSVLLFALANVPPSRAQDGKGGVQMLVPGFEIAPLPLKLPNINNVVYRPDGNLIAGAYDGNIYLISDSDGDGLEDTAKLWWDSKGKTRGPLGIALTPPGFAHGNGVIVPSKGKLSLITDDDGDDVADREQIIAEGWPEGKQAVDAVAVAIDPDDHSIYFGIGTALYNNAYLLDDNGKAHFDINGELGTIQHISPDLKSRETVCTGIRFSCAMRFNEHGDLFATDQEGATWMPNGNPFDELLQIQTGRHYGFPPMHPKHLPGLIDEPSLVDYKPQHQSTCGLNFNVPVIDGGPIFGPEFWRNDALVIGESRGKIWRTKLVKRPEGYLSQTQLIACINRLTIDGCVSPDGDFVICTHSGDPDWGTGPSGEGILYKVRYTGRDLPQPVLSWAQDPGEFRVAFDRPLDPAYLKKLSADKAVKIEYGDYVSAGDRLESMRPGYEVVRAQMATERYDLPVHQVQVTPDRRTLVILADQQAGLTRYSIQLPGFGDGDSMDVGCDATGVKVQRFGSDENRWSGWLPCLDIKAAKELTVGSAEHDRLWEMMEQGGALAMSARLDLRGMLRPVIQPGSSIDFEYPAEKVTVTVASPDFSFQIVGAKPDTLESSKGHTAHSVSIDFDAPEFVGFAMMGKVPEGAVPSFTVNWNTNEDPRQRSLQLARVVAPWAKAGINTVTEIVRAQPQIQEVRKDILVGVDVQVPRKPSWLKGREIFFSERAQCSKCHQSNGAGYQVGPDLGNLIHRDLGSITRDIQNPGAAIHPDFVTYRVTLKDGTEQVGTLQTIDGKTILGTAAGIGVPLVTADIISTEPLPVSIMPPGLDKVLGEADFKHLLKFLMNPGLEPAPLERIGAPAPRSLAEVQNVLAAQTVEEKAVTDPKPLRILLCTGPKDHGPGEHDYPLFRERWAKLLPLAENVAIDVADPWPSSEQFEKADVAVFYSANPGWNLKTAHDLMRFQERGGGVVIVHWAVHGGEAPDRFAEHIGLSGIPTMRYRHGALRLDFTNTSHPITRGFLKNHFVDESYWGMVGDPEKVNLLATSAEEGGNWPQVWTFERGKGRVFVSIPGHYSWTFDDPLFRVLLLRGLCWSAREPADRLSGLSEIGARLTKP